MFTQFGWLDSQSQTYVVLAAAADALFYFLPMFLAITAAKRFKANQFTAMAIGGALVYPSIVALATAGDAVSFAGLPVVMMNYTSSVVPIIVAVWLQGHFERFLNRVIPAAFRNFSTPLLTIAVMVPLVLLTVGPVTTIAARAVAAGVNAAFAFAPWLAGAIMGGLWQVFVLFGLHWGLVPVMTTEISTQGFSLIMGPLVAAVLAQAAATLAVFMRTRNKARREVAGPAAFSGFLAGITEPAIYGVNLPLKKPFYFGIAGGAIGGAIAASGGSASTAFVFPSLLALPAFTQVGSFALQVIGVAAAVGVAFTLTFVFGPRETEQVDAADEAAFPAEAAGHAAATATPAAGSVTVQAPVSGHAVVLTAVPDKVFASGALGKGLGIVPSDGLVYAPVSGTVISALKAGHAYGIKSPEGVEVLVHVGIDTVNLDGRGFTPAVTQGQQVRAGDLMAEVDLRIVSEAGFDPTTVVVVTNTAQLAAVEPTDLDELQHGEAAALVRV